MTSERALLASKVADSRLPPQEAAFWARYSHPLNVLIFSKEWCQDSVRVLAPLVAVDQTTPAITVRVRLRSEAAGLARALLENECPPVPVFLFYDAAFHEPGRLIASPLARTRQAVREETPGTATPNHGADRIEQLAPRVHLPPTASFKSRDMRRKPAPFHIRQIPWVSSSFRNGELINSVEVLPFQTVS